MTGHQKLKNQLNVQIVIQKNITNENKYNDKKKNE